MKKLTLNLNLLGYKNKTVSVVVTDYDLEHGLCRYQNAVYDIASGLWICVLDNLKDGIIDNDIKTTIKPNKKLTATQMIPVLIKNKEFMHMLEQQRAKWRRHHPNEEKNIIQTDTLFNNTF